MHVFMDMQHQLGVFSPHDFVDLSHLIFNYGEFGLHYPVLVGSVLSDDVFIACYHLEGNDFEFLILKCLDNREFSSLLGH
jgi:hypothetical protein